MDDDQRVLAEGSAALDISRPRPGWSEQDPDAWWAAADAAVSEIRTSSSGGLGVVLGDLFLDGVEVCLGLGGKLWLTATWSALHCVSVACQRLRSLG